VAFVAKRRQQHEGGSVSNRGGAGCSVVGATLSAPTVLAPGSVVLPGAPPVVGVLAGGGTAQSGGLAVPTETAAMEALAADGSEDILVDIGPKGVHDWLMSGPKVVQDASIAIQNMGPVPDRDRAHGVISAVALALGIELEIEDVPTSEDHTDRGDGGAALLPINCPEEGLVTYEVNIGKEPDASKEVGAAGDVVDGRLPISRPDVGQDASEVGWKEVGKKGKRKKK